MIDHAPFCDYIDILILIKIYYEKTKEIWTPAVYIFENGTTIEFQGYAVSDQGRVKSLNYNRTGKEKIMSQHISRHKDSTIYYMVGMWCKSKKKHFIQVHRLILSSFKKSEFFPGAVVNHKTERTATSCINKLSNLAWVTRQQNNSTDHRKALISKALTNCNTTSKKVRVKDLSTGDITEYPSSREADRILGLPRCAVSKYIRNYNGYYKKMNLMFSYIE